MEMNWGGIKGTKEKGTGTSHMTLREKIETFAKKKKFIAQNMKLKT